MNSLYGTIWMVVIGLLAANLYQQMVVLLFQLARTSHEVGHQLGMASDGSGPDKIPTYYNNSQGHVGSHCHFGIPAGQARYDSMADRQGSRCVMYGVAGCQRSFCRHCAEALKKADLKNGV